MYDRCLIHNLIIAMIEHAQGQKFFSCGLVRWSFKKAQYVQPKEAVLPDVKT